MKLPGTLFSPQVLTKKTWVGIGRARRLRSFQAKRLAVALVFLGFFLPSGESQDEYYDDPYSIDSDSDGYSDGEESDSGYDPSDPNNYPGYEYSIDSDSDGYSDYDEEMQGFDPADASSYPGSSPDDYYDDYYNGYDPWSEDSDGDSYSDGEEESNGTDPYDSSSFPGMDYLSYSDSDGDGYTDDEESMQGTDPNNSTDFPGSHYYYDSDGDGFSDGDEEMAGTSSSDPNEYPGSWEIYYTDSDSDGYYDSEESSNGTDPNDPFDYPGSEFQVDSDGDGTSDGDELSFGTSPNDPSEYPGWEYDADSDGDGYTDYEENMEGSDPYDSSSYPYMYYSYDSDGDGYTDYDEDMAGSDSSDYNSTPENVGGDMGGDEYYDSYSMDSDGDGLNDGEEIDTFGTDPSLPDTDGDGLSDSAEVYGIHVLITSDDGYGNTYEYSDYLYTNPTKTDSDGDLLEDGWEVENGTRPDDASDGLFDEDKDGLTLGQEIVFYDTDPTKRDSDDDGEKDGFEVEQGTDPRNASSRTSVDTDGDIMSDTWEISFGLDPEVATDGGLDLDGDGLLNFREYLTNADPTKIDSDGDDFADGVEWEKGFDPDDPDDATRDSDNDSMPDLWEVLFGLNPNSNNDAGSDGDGDLLYANEEFAGGFSPLNPDTNEDGVSDYDEFYGADPLAADSDGDGLNDNEELAFGTDPHSTDSDGDLLSDLAEVRGVGVEVTTSAGVFMVSYTTSPLSGDSDGDGLSDYFEIHNLFDPTSAADAQADDDSDGISNHDEIVIHQTDWNESDTDSDGESDSIEIANSTDPTDPASNRLDADHDLIRDSWELAHGLDPTEEADAFDDEDGDGITNLEEFRLNTNPRSRDSDGDGYDDEFELAHQFDPANPTDVTIDEDQDLMGDLWELAYGLDRTNDFDATGDVDGDGLLNVDEFLWGTDPTETDTDGDDLSDHYEVVTEYTLGSEGGSVILATSPLEIDSDQDLLPDGFEVANQFSPIDSSDGSADADSDGLSNGLEVGVHNTDWEKRDSDGDGEWDGYEVEQGTEPLNIVSRTSIDSDGDHMSDVWESENGLDPELNDGILDSDVDGLNNYGEYIAGTDPFTGDSDGDGYEDGFEREHNRNPKDPSDALTDTDEDGLPDLWEIFYGLPLNNDNHPTDDPDGDEVQNYLEFLNNTSPLEGDTDGDGLSDFDEIAGTGQLQDGTSWSFAVEPDLADTDDDGQDDKFEIANGSDPTDPESHFISVPETGTTFPGDSSGSGDGDSNTTDFSQGTNSGGGASGGGEGSGASGGQGSNSSSGADNPAVSDFGTGDSGVDALSSLSKPDDTDGDGISNSQERIDGTDENDRTDFLSALPAGLDQDRDGLDDGWETNIGLDPQDRNDSWRDPDYDRLSNTIEFQNSMSPFVGWKTRILSDLEGTGLKKSIGNRFPHAPIATLNDFGELVKISPSRSGIILSKWNDGLWSAPEEYVTNFDVEWIGEVVQNNLGLVAFEAGRETTPLASKVFVVQDGTLIEISANENWGEVHDLTVTDSGFVTGKYDNSNGVGQSLFIWRKGDLEIFQHIDELDIRGTTERGEILESNLGLFRANEWDGTFSFHFSISDFGTVMPTGSVADVVEMYPYSLFDYVTSFREILTGVTSPVNAEYVKNFTGQFDTKLNSFLITYNGTYLDYNTPYIPPGSGVAEGGEFSELSSDVYAYIDPYGMGFQFDFDYDNDGFWDRLELAAGTSASDSGSFPGMGSNVVINDANRQGDFVGWIFTGEIRNNFDDGGGDEFPDNKAFLWQYRDFSFLGGASSLWKLNNSGAMIASSFSSEEIYEEQYYDSTGDGIDDSSDITGTGQISLVENFFVYQPDNDADGNGLADEWEQFHSVSDPNGDAEGDGLLNHEEFVFGTSPNHWDTDGDHLSDIWEIRYGSNPTKYATDLEEDLDGDTLGWLEEYLRATDPFEQDTDGDGVSDQFEPILRSVPVDSGNETGGPDDGTGGPDDGTGGPDDGTGGPDDGIGGPDDGTGGPDDGTGGPDDGTGGPDWTEDFTFESEQPEISGWNRAAVGADLRARFETQSDGVLVESRGWGMKDIWDGTGFFFRKIGFLQPNLYAPLPVFSADAADSATAGFMIRENLRADSAFIAVEVRKDGRIRILKRENEGAVIRTAHQVEGTNWVEFSIRRTADSAVFLGKDQGNAWHYICETAWNGYAECFAGGFCSAGENRDVPARVRFPEFTFQSLTASWREPDHVLLSGVFEDDNTFKLEGASQEAPWIRRTAVIVELGENATFPVSISLQGIDGQNQAVETQLEIDEPPFSGNSIYLGTYPMLSDTTIGSVFPAESIQELRGLILENVSPLDSDILPGTPEWDESYVDLLSSIPAVASQEAFNHGEGNGALPPQDSDYDGYSDIEETEGVPTLAIVYEQVFNDLGEADGFEALEVPGTVATSPADYDTDDDGIGDYNDLYPTNPANGLADSENDGLTRAFEAIYSTDSNEWDTDGDGFSDGDEVVRYGTDPDQELSVPSRQQILDLQPSVSPIEEITDADRDGLLDSWERTYFGNLDTAATGLDSDGDGINDEVEFDLGSKPNASDSDDDGWSDWLEFVSQSDLTSSDVIPADSDGDDLPDGWEIHFFDSLNETGVTDPDGDLVYNLEELAAGTDPTESDTDQDTWTDRFELDNGYDPLNSGDANIDGDSDGLTLAEELVWNTFDDNRDSDGDLESDGYEVFMGTDPTSALSKSSPELSYIVPDEDLDGMDDEWEISNQLDPGIQGDALLDSDGDSLLNLYEHIYELNPTESDSDGDGFSDRVEIEFGWDPATDQFIDSFDRDEDGLPDDWEHFFGFTPQIKIVNILEDEDGNIVYDDYGNMTYDVEFTHLPEDYVHYDTPEDRAAGNPSETFQPHDFDGDGLTNLEEYHLGTNPILSDTDSDGVGDFEEAVSGGGDGDPTGFPVLFGEYAFDTDGDEIPDLWEEFLGLDRTSADDALEGSLNGDEDRLANYWEYRYRTNINNFDSDDDGYSDGLEVRQGANPRSAEAEGDYDGDEMPDRWELLNLLNPAFSGDAATDADQDGLSNLTEYQLGLDPQNHDSDGDGLWDGDEVETYFTDPLNPDTDGDTFTDGAEVLTFGTSPTKENVVTAGQPTQGAYVDPERYRFLPTSSMEVTRVYRTDVWPEEEEEDPECGGIGLGYGEYWANGQCWPNCPPGTQMGLQDGSLECLPIEEEEDDDFKYPKISGETLTGSEYRKISLNGTIIRPRSPEEAPESDAVREETYIDAYDLTLHHSTSDIYISSDGSEIPLSISRNLSPDQRSPYPGRDLTMPFGPEWTSNVACYIRLEEYFVADEETATTATVVDEAGIAHRFIFRYGIWYYQPSAGGSPEAIEMKLSMSMGSARLSKKYGSTVDYHQISYTKEFMGREGPGRGSGYYVDNAPIETENDVSNDDPLPFTRISYYRANKVSDRNGNQLDYSYPGNETVIPSSIYDSRRGRGVSISQNSMGRVTAIMDPNGNVTRYSYDKNGRLENVRRPSGRTITYGSGDQGYSISDSLNGTISFSGRRKGRGLFVYWNPEHEKYVSAAPGSLPDDEIKLSQANFEASVSGPSGTVFFKGARFIKMGVIRENSIPIEEAWSHVDIVNAEGGQIRYTFHEPKMYDMNFLPGSELNPYYKHLAIAFNAMTVSAAGGNEYYRFDPSAGFAPKLEVDYSGNVTRYGYGVRVNGNAMHGLTNQGLYLFSPRPIWKAEPKGVTSYTYAHGRTVFESFGGRTKSYAYSPGGNLLAQKTFEGDNLVESVRNEFGPFGFRTKSIVEDLSGEGRDLVTAYEAGPYLLTEKQIVDPDGLALETRFGYDANGNLRSSTDPNGFTTRFEYDSFNRVVKTIDPPFSQPQIDSEGPSAEVFTSHKTISREAGTFGGEKTITSFFENDTLVRQTVEERDARRALVMSGNDLDFDGQLNNQADVVTLYEHDNIGNPTLVVDPEGNRTRYEYDVLGRKTREIRGEGTSSEAVTQFEYSRIRMRSPVPGVPSSGGVASTNIGGLRTGFKPSRITTEKTTTTMSYDSSYRPVEVSVDYGGGTAVTKTTYDPHGNAIQVEDPLGLITATEFDGNDRPTKKTVGLGTNEPLITETIYSSTGLTLESIDVFGQSTTTNYDTAGRAIEVVSPVLKDSNGAEILDSNGSSSVAVTSTVYDSNGNATSVTDPRGNTTDTVYDSRNRPIMVIAPPAQIDGAGDEVRAYTLNFYDARGNVVKAIDPDGNVTETEYDYAGRPLTVTAPAVDVFTEVDADGEAVFTPNTVMTVSTEYDKNGNPVSVTDPNGNTVSNEYNSLNQLIQTVDAEGIVTQFTYDSLGNRTSVTDGLGQVTVFEYDGLKRNTKIDYPPGVQDVINTYNAGSLISRNDGNGKTDYAYDAFHRLQRVSYEDGANREYSYDKAGRILSVIESTDSRANVLNSYDSWGRVESELSNGVTHHYDYDVSGNRTRVTYGLTGQVVESTYDSWNRLASMVENGRVTRYGYDRAGKVTRKELANGQLVQIQYDGQSRRVSTITRAPDANSAIGRKIYHQEYFYDEAGNLMFQKEQIDDFENPGTLRIRTVENTYDRNYRLQAERINDSGTVSISEYDYDDANNRTALREDENGDSFWDQISSYDYTGGWNQLREYTKTTGTGALIEDITFTYDENGNRQSRDATIISFAPDNATVEATRTENDTYHYDRENRLIKVLDDSGDGVINEYRYIYDYRTRRIVRDESRGITPSGAAGEVTSVVFSGGTSAQEWDSGELEGALTAGSISISARPEVTYVRGSDWGGGVGGVLYTLRAEDGTTDYDATFNFYNSRGDVIAKTDETGSFTWQGEYEAFGKRTHEVGENPDRQRGNTKDEDPTGLLNEGFRYRDLETGTWLTRDPAGFVDGPNLYAYVNQNPWTRFDPLGLMGTGMGFGQISFTGERQTTSMATELLDPEYRKGYNLSSGHGIAAGIVAPIAVYVGPVAVAKEVGSEVLSQGTGGATDLLSTRKMLMNAPALLRKAKGKIVDFLKKGGNSGHVGTGPKPKGKSPYESASEEKVYHGTTDKQTVTTEGLNQNARDQAAGDADFADQRGFSTTSDKSTAEAWAEHRALERGENPVVLEANVKDLPSPRNRPGESVDPGEYRIDVEDYDKVGPEVFKETTD